MDTRSIHQFMGGRSEVVVLTLGDDFLKLVRQPDGRVFLEDKSGCAPDDWRPCTVGDIRSEVENWFLHKIGQPALKDQARDEMETALDEPAVSIERCDSREAA